jgi:hypothetical protein
MNKKSIHTVLFLSLFILFFGLLGCSSSTPNPSAGTEQGIASEEDIAALSQVSGQEFDIQNNTDPSEAQTLSGDIASIASKIQSVANGTEFSFFDTILTVQEGQVTYNNHAYTFLSETEEDDEVSTIFYREIDSTHFEEIQIQVAEDFLSNWIIETQVGRVSNKVVVTILANATHRAIGDQTGLSRLDVTNETDIITYNELEFVNHVAVTYKGTIDVSIPISMVINGITFSGEFTGILEFDTGEFIGSTELTSPLIRNGVDIGEMRIGDDDILRIYVRNSSGVLEEVSEIE